MAAAQLLNFRDYLSFLPTISKTPDQTVWMTYDQEADVLYVNLKKPSIATDSELTDEDVLVRYEGEAIIGYTVLHASHR